MTRRRVSIILLVLGIYILLISSISLARSSTNYTIYSDAVANGGGPISSAHYSLDATVGQIAFGLSSNTHYRLTGGYWERGPGDRKVHLPIILK